MAKKKMINYTYEQRDKIKFKIAIFIYIFY